MRAAGAWRIRQFAGVGVRGLQNPEPYVQDMTDYATVVAQGSAARDEGDNGQPWMSFGGSGRHGVAVVLGLNVEALGAYLNPKSM